MLELGWGFERGVALVFGVISTGSLFLVCLGGLAYEFSQCQKRGV